MKKIFIFGLTVMAIDVVNKNLYNLFPTDKQDYAYSIGQLPSFFCFVTFVYYLMSKEYVYCVGQSISFLAYIVFIHYILTKINAHNIWYKATKVLFSNLIFAALVDLYDEAFGDPYTTNFWEYFPLYTMFITVTATLLNFNFKHLLSQIKWKQQKE